MKSNVPLWFWTSLLASVGLLSVLTMENASALFVSAGGFLPLVHYHFRLLFAVRKHSLPQATVDTVYYLGFLITIATLVLSVLKVGLGDSSSVAGKDGFQNLAVVFGSGLLATGYALFARIQLMMMSEKIEEEDLGDKVDRYALEAEKALNKLRLSAAEFEVFTATLRDSALRAIDDSAAAYQQAIAATATTATKNVETALKSLSESLVTLQQDIRTATPTEELAEVASAVKALGKTLSNASTKVDMLAAQAASGEQSLLTLATSMTNAASEIARVESSLRSIVEFSSPLADLRATVAEIGPSLRALGADALEARNGVTQAAAGLREEVLASTNGMSTLGHAAQSLTESSRSVAAQLAVGEAAGEQLGKQILELTKALEVARQRFDAESAVWAKSLTGQKDALDAHTASAQNQTRLVEAEIETRQKLLVAQNVQLANLSASGDAASARFAETVAKLGSLVAAIDGLNGAIQHVQGDMAPAGLSAASALNALGQQATQIGESLDRVSAGSSMVQISK